MLLCCESDHSNCMEQWARWHCTHRDLVWWLKPLGICAAHHPGGVSQEVRHNLPAQLPTKPLGPSSYRLTKRSGQFEIFCCLTSPHWHPMTRVNLKENGKGARNSVLWLAPAARLSMYLLVGTDIYHCLVIIYHWATSSAEVPACLCMRQCVFAGAVKAQPPAPL